MAQERGHLVKNKGGRGEKGRESGGKGRARGENRRGDGEGSRREGERAYLNLNYAWAFDS